MTLPTSEPYNTWALTGDGGPHSASSTSAARMTKEYERAGESSDVNRGLELVMTGSPLNIRDSGTRGTGP